MERIDGVVELDGGADEVEDIAETEIKELDAETKLLVDKDELVKLVVVVLDAFSGVLVLVTLANVNLGVVVALPVVLLNPELPVGVAILVKFERVVLMATLDADDVVSLPRP